MKSGRATAVLLLAGATVVGCASQKKSDGDGRASSLVYSPAERLPPDRETRGAHAADSSATVVASQEDPVRPPAGRRCRVHFRREAMGVAGQAPYPLSGNNLATDRAQVTGTLERVGRDWLVVRGDRSTYWIPREAVLAVEFAEQQ
jgi:hypothetical protein